MPAGITIRPGRLEDVAAVLDFWTQAAALPSVTDTLEGLARLLHEPGAVLLLAMEGDTIAGTVLGGWDGWRGNIYRLAVLLEYRRRGIARALVQEVEQHLAARGARRFAAVVEGNHRWAVGFWSSIYEREPNQLRYVKNI